MLRLLFLCFLFFTIKIQGQESERWVVYYSDQAPFKAFLPYSLAVFDSDSHPPLYGFNEQGITVLGYISLGEVEKHRYYFERAKKEGLLLIQNPTWTDSYMVDLRNPKWAKMVLEELIPKILFQRFDGIFIDTLDNAEYLENLNPNAYKGMKNAAVQLMTAIRLQYPTIKIMLNRAYFLLPQVVKQIDMVLGESVYTTYRFETKTYGFVSKQDYQEQVKLLKEAQQLDPHLQVFTLDYWDPKDTQRIKQIYQIERENGFIPYVSTPSLNQIVPEPK